MKQLQIDKTLVGFMNSNLSIFQATQYKNSSDTLLGI